MRPSSVQQIKSMPIARIHIRVFSKFPILVIRTRWRRKLPSVNVDWVPGNRPVLAAVQSVNRSYILRAQFEVIDRCVANHAHWVRGFRQGRESKNKAEMRFSSS